MAYAEFNVDLATYIGMANTGINTKTFTIDELEPGNYSIYSAWINSCGNLAGEISEAYDITVIDNVIQLVPTHNPKNIRIQNLAAGEFKIKWDYINLLTTDIRPTKFYCQASLLRYSGLGDDGRNRVLFSNPADKQRIKMTVRLSYDDCSTWPAEKLLYEGPSAYSCLTVLPDKSIGCLYEKGREHAYETITFAVFNLEWLTDGADWIR